MVHSMNDNNPLSGVTVLVVEDDLFLAMALEDTLAGMGAVVVDVCHTLDEAMARADADDFAVAVLDFSLGSDQVTTCASSGTPKRALHSSHRDVAQRTELDGVEGLSNRRETSLSPYIGGSNKKCAGPPARAKAGSALAGCASDLALD